MTQTRTIALILAVAVLCALSAAGGGAVATWRAEAGHAKVLQERDARILKLEGEKHALELAIAEQNQAVAVAEAETRGAKQAQEQAQQHAEAMAAFSKSRMDKLERFMAETAEQVLKAYWELRQ